MVSNLHFDRMSKNSSRENKRNQTGMGKESNIVFSLPLLEYKIGNILQGACPKLSLSL